MLNNVPALKPVSPDHRTFMLSVYGTPPARTLTGTDPVPAGFNVAGTVADRVGSAAEAAVTVKYCGV